MMAQLDPGILALLRCPVTASPLRQQGDWLMSEIGNLAYSLREGIPALLAEEARLPPGIGSLEDFKAKYCPTPEK